MATTPETRRRADLWLRTTALILGDLPEVAEEWESLDDGERVSWSMDWGNEMGGLELLARDADAGLLTPEQQQRFQELVRRLQAALPLMQRLDLAYPSFLLG